MFELKASLQDQTLTLDDLIISLSHDPADLVHLADEWRALQAASAMKSLFVSPEWTQLVWGHFGTPGNLWLLTARDGDGRLVGLAPLMIHKYRPFAGVQWRQLGFVAQTLATSHIDFIALPGADANVARGFLARIQAEKHRWDTLHLANLSADSETWTLFHEDPSISLDETEPEEMACIAFKGNWDDYYNAISSGKRKEQRKFHRQIDEAFPNRWGWEAITDPAALGPAMEDMIRLHQAKWEAAGELGAFGKPEVAAFHRNAAATLLQQGILRLYRLSIDGKTAAVLYGYRYMGRHYDFVSGWEITFADWSPGEILTGLVLRQAVEEGCTHYDFMMGAQPYKLRWGAETAPSQTVQWVASARARRERSLILKAREAWQKVKAALPEDFRRRVVRVMRPNGLNSFAVGVATLGNEALGAVTHITSVL